MKRAESNPQFSARLLAWHRQHGRHDLPWQHEKDPYRIWLSEIMLQQTQVATVIPYYQRFLLRFPTLHTLAAASCTEVMAMWSGLGYYARARNLHACAQAIVSRGAWPRDATDLAALPGIGRSTANAIANFCFAARLPILDGNVRRVLSRVYAYSAAPATSSRAAHDLWALAAALLPDADLPAYTQAQMDLGALLCTRRKPRCAICPLVGLCRAQAQGNPENYPEPRLSRSLPWRAQGVLLLAHRGRLLFTDRPPKGIWGGLYGLPELAAPTLAAARAWTREKGWRVARWQALAERSHRFTHFGLRLKPILGQMDSGEKLASSPDLHWLTQEAIAGAPLPAPLRVLCQAYFQMIEAE